MLFDYKYQNPSVCCFLVQIWAIAVFACNKPLRWVPAKFAGNPTHAKKRDHVATLPSSRSLFALKTQFRLFSDYTGHRASVHT